MSRCLITIPKMPELILDNFVLLVFLRRRLGRNVPVVQGPRAADCTVIPDELGHHRMNCNKTGLLVRRHYFMRDAWHQIFYEAGGRVQNEVPLAETRFVGSAANGPGCPRPTRVRR